MCVRASHSQVLQEMEDEWTICTEGHFSGLISCQIYFFVSVWVQEQVEWSKF